MIKKILYYHMYLTDEPSTWTNIFLEQMKAMEDSGLLSELDMIKIVAITQDDERIRELESLCSTEMAADKGVNFDIHFVKNPWANDIAMMENLESPHTITENYTFRRIYEDCQNAEEEFYVMYIHTKGITSCMRLMSKNCILAQSFKNYYYWRQFLNWGVIKRWRSCVDALDYHDVAGVNFFSSPSPHFSGNFWWAKSSYIKTLPNPATKDWWYALKEKTSNIWLKGASDRFRDEQWVCSNPDVKVYKVIDMDEGNNPAGKYLPTTMYDPD